MWRGVGVGGAVIHDNTQSVSSSTRKQEVAPPSVRTRQNGRRSAFVCAAATAGVVGGSVGDGATGRAKQQGHKILGISRAGLGFHTRQRRRRSLEYELGEAEGWGAGGGRGSGILF